MSKKPKPPRARLYINRARGRAVICCKGHRFVWHERANAFTCCGFLIFTAPQKAMQGATVITDAQGHQIGENGYLWPEHAAEYLGHKYPHEFRRFDSMIQESRKDMRARIKRNMNALKRCGAVCSRAWLAHDSVLLMLDNPAISMGQIIESDSYRTVVTWEIEIELLRGVEYESATA